MEDILVGLGPIALGSRLKRLGERMQADAQDILASVGLSLAPGEVGLVAALDRNGPLTVTAAAAVLGISQPGLTRMAGSLKSQGLISIEAASKDGRTRLLDLTGEGRAAVAVLRARVWNRLPAVVDELCGGDAAPVLEAVATLEQSLAAEPMAVRIERQLRLVPWQESRAEELARAFHDINAAWISAMFALEEMDRKVLGDPRSHILDKGGSIWFVEAEGHGLIGACALMPAGPGEVELTKMGVLEHVRGRKAGEFLLCAVLQEARRQKIETLFLLTNTACAAAIHLYEKLGFVHDRAIMDRFGCEYARCDVAMRYSPAL